MASRNVLPFPAPATTLRAVSYPLPAGDRGTAKTISFMRGLVAGKDGIRNPYVHAQARDITSGVPNRDFTGEVNAVYDWVKSHIKFRNEADEVLQSPYMTLQVGAGDCDDHSTLIAALLRSLGHNVTFRTVSLDSGDYSHVYAMVQDRRNGQWIAMDTTVRNAHPGWQPSGIKRARSWRPMGDSIVVGTKTADAVAVINQFQPIINAIGQRIAHGKTPGFGLDANLNLATSPYGDSGISTSALIFGGLALAAVAYVAVKP